MKEIGRGTVLQSWLAENCSWKQQTVLLASFRGCDGLPKNDPSKEFTKMMRFTLLKNDDKDTTFFGNEVILSLTNKSSIDDFFIDCSRGNLDAYPVHWLMHLLQAAEIIMYKASSEDYVNYWQYFYLTGVRALHLNPETEEQLDIRLKDKSSY